MPKTCFVAAGVLVLFTAGCSDTSRPAGPGGSTAPLKVNAVSPNTGPTTGSTAIQILGTGFVNGSTLTLDGAPTPATFVNTTTLRATAPSHPAGPIDIVVRNPNGDSSELKGGFRYEVALSNLTLTGNLSLQSVGETSQLTATALYADGTTGDVTRDARWTVTLTSVATIGADGVLTARALGSTSILLQYPSSGRSLFRSAEVVVTPAGTRAVWGRVREPGAGGIADARVAHRDTGQSAQTAASGFFTLGGLSGALRFSVTKSGFEDAETEAGDENALDIPMQRVVRIEAGAPMYSSSLAPNDLEYEIAGTHCQPCRMIRITSPASGTVNITLRWTTVVNLHIWSDGRMIDAEGTAREIVMPIQVSAGERQVFVGTLRPAAPGDYVPFTVSVSGVQ